jgi:hypothetical protein
MSDTVTATRPVQTGEYYILNQSRGLDAITKIAGWRAEPVSPAASTAADSVVVVLRYVAGLGLLAAITGFIWSLLSLSALPSLVLLFGISLFMIAGYVARRKDRRYSRRSRHEWRIV